MTSPKTAFLFPGQGRIPKELPPTTPLQEALLSAALERELPIDELLHEQDADRLARTENAQPILLIDSLDREQTLRDRGWKPDVVAGHSLGEYAALVSAGTLTATDSLRVVIERGRLMGTVEGGMTAIVKLDLRTVRELCDKVGEGVCIANHNAPTQVVVSGHPAALEQLAAQVAEAGGRAIPLRVSGPFHSPSMRPAQASLEPVLRALTFRDPLVPVVSGVTARPETDGERLREVMCGQITSPVHWVDVVESLVASGATRAVEIGSGEVLTKLGRQITDAVRFMTYEEALDETV